MGILKWSSIGMAGEFAWRLAWPLRLTLKGLFYDGQEFAVVEVENIVTKKTQYFRSSVNKALGSHKLEQIGKNFVVVSSGNQRVTLYMFGAGRS